MSPNYTASGSGGHHLDHMNSLVIDQEQHRPCPAQVPLIPNAERSCASMSFSPWLTRSAWKPMNPPSFAASAAFCAHSMIHARNSSASSGLAFALAISLARDSSSTISLPAMAPLGLKSPAGFLRCSASPRTSRASSPVSSSRCPLAELVTTLTTAEVSFRTSIGPPGSASVIAMPATIGERTSVAHSSSVKSAFVVISRPLPYVARPARQDRSTQASSALAGHATARRGSSSCRPTVRFGHTRHARLLVRRQCHPVARRHLRAHAGRGLPRSLPNLAGEVGGARLERATSLLGASRCCRLLPSIAQASWRAMVRARLLRSAAVSLPRRFPCLLLLSRDNASRA